METLISIIVPVYMTEQYLKKCIESICSQTYNNIEIILVDDGSYDRCGEICDKYKEKDARIKVIHKENGGLSSARNAGIDAATGEYIAFVDSDDSISSVFIETLYCLCKKYDCLISQCDFLFVDEDSICLDRQLNCKEEVITGKEAIYRCCKQPDAVKYNVAWNKLYKKELFQNIRYPEGKIHEDEYTSWKIFSITEKVAISNGYLYWYLQRKNSIVSEKYNIKRLDRLEAYQIRLDYLLERDMTDAIEVFLPSYYHTLWSSYEQVKKCIDNCEPILNDLKQKADRLEVCIFENSKSSLLSKIRMFYPYKSDSEKQIIQKIYGTNFMSTKSENFLFPFSRIPVKSRIAIYGAGNVGKAYYQQVISSQYAVVTLWVDWMWRSMAMKGLDVRPIDALFQNKYDYVIIANKNRAAAMEIRDNLIGWGISEDKIVWENPKLLNLNEAKETKFFLDEVCKYCQKDYGRFILMNTPDHGNMGDHALALAALKFFNKYFPQYEVVEFTGKQWDYCYRIIQEQLNHKDIIFFVGGGYMGNVWPKESERVRKIIEAFPDNKKVFLPQTFYYQENDFGRDFKFYGCKENILYIHREHNSYDMFLKNVVVKKECNLLYPDMVFGLADKQTEGIRDGIKICIRRDKERIIDSRIIGKIEDYCQKEGINYSYIDTVIDRNINQSERSEQLNELFNNIKSARLLVTDRLHGMIFATILGTPCVVFDNLTGKIEGEYRWISNLKYVSLCENDDAILDNIRDMYVLKDTEYPKEFFKEEFQNMADDIRKWIED